MILSLNYSTTHEILGNKYGLIFTLSACTISLIVFALLEYVELIFVVKKKLKRFILF